MTQYDLSIQWSGGTTWDVQIGDYGNDWLLAMGSDGNLVLKYSNDDSSWQNVWASFTNGNPPG